MWNITSGSVIGPVLARELARRKKRVVIVVVADTMSETDATNTMKTLQTLEAICQQNNIYMPMMPFNNTGIGRNKVDITITHRVQQLVYLMTLAAHEVDRNDRLNFLNGTKTVSAKPGLRLLHVVGGVNPDELPESGEIWDHEEGAIFDSTLSIGTDAGTSENPKQNFVDMNAMARVAYVGVFQSNKLTPLMGMISGDTKAVSVLIKDIEDTAAKFASQSKNVASAISMDGVAVTDTGLVL